MDQRRCEPSPSHGSGSPPLRRSPVGRRSHLVGSSGDRTFGTSITPQLQALGELEFRRAFLILNYVGCSNLEVVNPGYIRGLKDSSIHKFESEIWSAFGQKYVHPADRRRSLEWDFGRTHSYHCHVSQDGTCKFKGPFLEQTNTHLQRVLGDENVLTVKFEDIDRRNAAQCAIYRQIAREGLAVGLRHYRFFVFKDGGKDKKKKDPTASGVKCYFVRTESRAAADADHEYILSGKPISEARKLFMHVHTLDNVAAYMARFSLILSKTRKLEVDLQDVVEQIDDIYCHDEDHYRIFDKNGEPCKHSDGTGFISEDLARLCPKVYKGNSINGYDFQKFLQQPEKNENTSNRHGLDPHSQQPPLLIQFRLFHDGRAIKGTFLLNKRLPPRTMQIRQSMIKVEADPNLSSSITKNDMGVVSTSNRPKHAKLSRNLIALLSYGGVPDWFFKKMLYDTLDEARGVFYSKRAALKILINKGEMDDFIAARMLLAGLPLDEPYLQRLLSILLKTEKNYLKAGRIPLGESYYLMGTVDPTRTLEKDEVCVVLDSGQISGQVLVYRNPGLHFGDVHILKATYIRALEDVIGNAKYAIFFSQKGPRSVADEIAGGDYDGDMYFVSRNPELLKYFKPSEPWVPLSSSPAISSNKKPPSDFSAWELEEELFEQFLEARFKPSNIIGLAADCWLAIMDRFLSLGNSRPDEKAKMEAKILHLIDIYYDALDAPKKGVKIDLPEELRPERFPHYLERERSFTSKSILGQLYDLVMDHENEDLPKVDIRKISCFEDCVPHASISKWEGLYESYRRDMREALQINGNEKNDAANEVIQRYKEKLYGAGEYEESKRSWLELRDEGLAIYNVNYTYAMKIGSVERCGFAWKVAGPILCRAYMEKLGQKPVLISTSSSVLKELCG